MGKRKVTILEPAATSVAEIAMFIEGKGLSLTAKKFVDEVFAFFEKLSDDRVTHLLVLIINGNGWITDVCHTKRSMLLLI